MASNNNKMKGLLKGLRYISQIFENEKEPEMQIGLPTDVKHVAHIGWDGPSVNNAPSWMNEYKSAEGFSSGPLPNGEDNREGDSVKWVSEDSGIRKGSRGQSSPPRRDTPELPKSSRRSSSTNGTGESSLKEKSDKPRQSRKSSKGSSSDINTKSKKAKDPNKAIDSASSQDLPTIPKKSRRKKSKDTSSVDGSSRRSRNLDMDNVSESGSVSRPREERLSNASSNFDQE